MARLGVGLLADEHRGLFPQGGQGGLPGVCGAGGWLDFLTQEHGQNVIQTVLWYHGNLPVTEKISLNYTSQVLQLKSRTKLAVK